MKRVALVLLPFVLLGMAPAGPPRLAERQLAFAEKLHADGEKAFALLEYKRFLFNHSDHPRAIDAALAAARLYVGYLEDAAGAKRTLIELAKQSPNSEADKRVREFLAFIEVHSDFQGKPLALFVSGTDAEGLGRHDEAAAAYADVSRKYPKARLADVAMYQLGRLLLEKMSQPQRAGETFAALLRQHPRSKYAADASYYQAVAMEKQLGPTPDVIAAYRNVAARYPNTEAARQATDRLGELTRSRHVLRRRHERVFVQSYQVLREGYLHGTKQYVVRILVAADLSERQLTATLEDALLSHYAKRARTEDPVVVNAYAKYPEDEAGSVVWVPDQLPEYKVAKRKGNDVLKDVLIDILRKL